MCRAMERAPDIAWAKLDAIAAFQNFLRETAMAVTAAEFPRLLRIYCNAYSTSSAVVFVGDDGRHAQVDCTHGSKQGDVLGAYAFAAAFSRPMRETKARYGDSVTILAIMDDVYLRAPVADLHEIVMCFAQRAEVVGVSLNLGKSAVYWPGGDIPEECLP